MFSMFIFIYSLLSLNLQLFDNKFHIIEVPKYSDLPRTGHLEWLGLIKKFHRAQIVFDKLRHFPAGNALFDWLRVFANLVSGMIVPVQRSSIAKMAAHCRCLPPLCSQQKSVAKPIKNISFVIWLVVKGFILAKFDIRVFFWQ